MTDTIPTEQNGNDEWHFDAVPLMDATRDFASVIRAKQNQFSGVNKLTNSIQEFIDLYEQDNFIGNVVDHLPDDAFQATWEYKIDGYEEKENPIEAELERFKPYGCHSCKQARGVFGYSAVHPIIKGETDLSEPLDERKLAGRIIEGYSVWAGGQHGDFTVYETQDNKFLPDYGMPLLYSVDGQLVHHSRVLLFTGVKRIAPKLRLGTSGSHLNDPGTSVIKRCYQQWQNFNASNNAIAATMPSFNQKILKIKDLFVLLAKEKEFKNIVGSMAFAMNVLGIMMVEADGGDYSVLSHQYSDVPALLDYFKKIFAGSTDLMASELFNESPAGVTSGSYEKFDKANQVHKYQISQLAPQVNKLIRIVSFMNGIDPKAGKLEFPSTYQLDKKDAADVELKEAQKIRALVGPSGGSIVLPEEAAEAMSTGVELGEVIDLTKERKPEPPSAMLGAQDPANPTDPTNPDNSLQQKQ